MLEYIGSAYYHSPITIDLGGVYSNISCLEYLPKQWNRNNSTDGDITNFTILTSTDGVNFTQRTTGTWAADRNLKFAEWAAVNAGYVRLQVNAASGSYANVSEIRVGGRTATPALVSATTMFKSSPTTSS